MSHPALSETDHRPWPLPRRAWSLTMDWEDLLFLHWRVDAERIQAALPAGVRVDSFAGSAWLGIVPFRMARTRLRWLPPIPTTHGFPELNVRTYVTCGGVPGVWFFSLDAASTLAVEGARFWFGLPYCHAAMTCSLAGDRITYRSERRDRRAPPARFAATWTTSGDARRAAIGSLDHFLTERYCLFAQRRGRLLRGDIAHAAWQLANADVELQECDMTRLLGFPLQGTPASALAAQPLRVAAWAPIGQDLRDRSGAAGGRPDH